MEPNTPEVASTAVDTQPQETGAQEVSQPTAAPTEGQPAERKSLLETLDALDIDTTVKEELRKGYMRQSDYTRKTQELSDLKRTLAEQPVQQAPQQQAPDLGLLDQYIDSRLAPVAERMAISEFSVNHPDAAELEPAMIEIMKNDPRYKSVEHLETVYKLAQYEKLQSEVKNAKDQGAKEALKAIKAEGKTFAEPTGAKQTATAPDLSKMTAAEIRAMIGGE